MAGFVPYITQATLLNLLDGSAALATRAMYLGLAISLPADPLTSTLSNIIEVTTTGYERATVPTFDAATQSPPVQAVVSSDFSFAAFSADMGDFASYAFLTDAAAGTSGTIWYVWELATPVMVPSGQGPTIPAGTLLLE